MSYVMIHSNITGLDRQYGLVDVELKHKVLNEDYGTISSGFHWNTHPIIISNIGKMYDSTNPEAPTSEIYPFMTTFTAITGRSQQSGVFDGSLISNYTSIYRGKHPIITNREFNVDEMRYGVNTYSLFETDIMKVELKCFKQNKIYQRWATNPSFLDFEGYNDNPDFISDVFIVFIMKNNNKIVGSYNFIYFKQNEVLLNRFTLDTTLMQIKNFVGSYSSKETYDSRYENWYDYGNKKDNCRIYTSENEFKNISSIVLSTTTLHAVDYWQAPRNSYAYTRKKVIKSDGSDISNDEARNINTNAEAAYFRSIVNETNTEFITFNRAIVGRTELETTYEEVNYTNNFIKENGEYKLKVAGSQILEDNVFTTDSILRSPLILPIVDDNFNASTVDIQSQATLETIHNFIPLTTTIFEGEPEPEPEPEPDIPDKLEHEKPDTETTIPADDPVTRYTPPQSEGEVEFTYPGFEDVNPPEIYNYIRPDQSIFCFNKMLKANSEQTTLSNIAYNFLYDCLNVSNSDRISNLYKLVSGKPRIEELISRIFTIPFEYSDLSPLLGLVDRVPIYPLIGPVTIGFNSDNEPTPQDVKYYKSSPNRFIQLNLGSKTIQRVFRNYLDYVGTKITLTLPYGMGIVDIDPNFLFMKTNNSETITGIVRLEGILDLEQGEMLIRVYINNHIYYEAMKNISMDVNLTVINNAETARKIGALGASFIAAVAGMGFKGQISEVKSQQHVNVEKGINDRRHEQRLAEIAYRGATDRETNRLLTEEIYKREEKVTEEMLKRRGI